MDIMSEHCLQTLSAPGPPQSSRQISTTIQRAADDFVRLIESERVKAREPLHQQLLTLGREHALFRQQAAAALGAALTRVGSAGDEIQKAKEVLAAREQEVEDMQRILTERDREISQLREQLLSSEIRGTDQIDGSQEQREDAEARMLRVREALEKEYDALLVHKNTQIDGLNARITELEGRIAELRGSSSPDPLDGFMEFLNVDECDHESTFYAD